MPRKLPLLVTLVLLSGLMMWLVAARGSNRPLDSASPVGARTIATEAPHRAAPAPIEHSAAAPGTTTRPFGSAARRASALRLTRIVGRCLDAADDPLCEVVVRVEAEPRDAEALALHELHAGAPLDWRPPEPVTSDAEGRFAIELDAPAALHFDLRLEPAHHGWQRFRLEDLAAGRLVDLGDIPFNPGVRVHGQVTGSLGIPLADLELRLEQREFAGQHRHSEHPALRREPPQTTVTTDRTGRFQCAKPMLAGRIEVRCVTAGHRLRGDDREHQLRPPDAQLQLIAHVEEDDPSTRPPLRGTVVDTAGRPVANAGVYIMWNPDIPHETQWLTNSDACGRFVVPGREPDAATGNCYRACRPGYEPSTWTEPSASGADDLRLVMRPGPTVTILAYRPDPRRPVERFGLRLETLEEDWRWDVDDNTLRYVGDHPGRPT